MLTPSSPQEIIAPIPGSIQFIIATLTFVTFLIHCLHSLGIHPDQVIQPSNTIARIFTTEFFSFQLCRYYSYGSFSIALVCHLQAPCHTCSLYRPIITTIIASSNCALCLLSSCHHCIPYRWHCTPYRQHHAPYYQHCAPSHWHSFLFSSKHLTVSLPWCCSQPHHLRAPCLLRIYVPLASLSSLHYLLSLCPLPFMPPRHLHATCCLCAPCLLHPSPSLCFHHMKFVIGCLPRKVIWYGTRIHQNVVSSMYQFSCSHWTCRCLCHWPQIRERDYFCQDGQYSSIASALHALCHCYPHHYLVPLATPSSPYHLLSVVFIPLVVFSITFSLCSLVLFGSIELMSLSFITALREPFLSLCRLLPPCLFLALVHMEVVRLSLLHVLP